MKALVLSIATLGVAAIAAPASAQNNPPVAGADFNTPAAAGAPPLSGPIEGGLKRGEWLAECERRVMSTPGADAAYAPGACQSWWAYYHAGGKADPTYGYAMPVQVTETITPDCPEEEKTVVETKVIQHRAIKRRPRYNDKRVAI